MPGLIERVRSRSPGDVAVRLATAAVLVVTVAALIAFFPRSGARSPRFAVAWPGRAERVLGPLDPVPAWSLAPLRLSGRGFQGTRVTIRIDGRGALDLPVQPDGTVRALFLVPAGLRRGLHQLAVVDQGSGQPAGRDARLVLVRGPAPDLWVGPEGRRRTVLVVAAGLTPGSSANLVIDPDAATAARVGSAVVRPSGRLALVLGVPKDVPAGSHRLRVIDAAGRHADAPIDVAG